MSLRVLICVAAALGALSGATPASAQQPGMSALFAVPPLDELKATRERPLFERERRPPSEEEEVAQEPEPQEAVPDDGSLPFELAGIVKGPDVSIAMLRHRETKEVQHLRPGEELAEWRIEEIAARHVVVRRGENKVRLELFEERGDAGGSQRHAAVPTTPRAFPRVPPPPMATPRTASTPKTVNRQQRRALPARQRQNQRQRPPRPRER
jgi:general secretion pathway protein N